MRWRASKCFSGGITEKAAPVSAWSSRLCERIGNLLFFERQEQGVVPDHLVIVGISVEVELKFGRSMNNRC
jgi:hypothetical protein